MNKKQHHIAVMVLAAGASTRMGKPKQLLPWKNTTLLGHVIQTAKASKASNVLAVLGAHADLIKSNIKEKVVFLENTSWQSGLGTSVTAGTEWLLQADIEFQGILIMLADQPLIDPEYLNMLIAISKQNPDKIIASAYKKRSGVPAIFPKKYADDLLKLNKDFGAKHLLQQEQLNVVKIPAAHRILDIDTQNDYEQLKRRNEI
ncbi:nucleotidyltransferase family protein [Zobellia uliginosa]|uniref:nucleotidyltransferase family protein n=1 Tax=Zobellia uliginosa TaxID=143224 RepID=UPI001C06CAFC|nr:nucleotidyltransferase family protein [Zobellia uliginosa]MBU2946447.1 nucleotidyltransferase family protein [Zobellia uliginosa]